ncbi:MAG: hypothetical protein IKQ33_01740 [Clostridia bacterium]|nr:hypothetical protein [Clostridia bacterium]
MDLWIRSQDKNNLIKANNIYSDVLPEDGYYKIFNMPDEDILGKYITKERALEVLDEINEILQLKLCTTLGTFEEVFKGYTEKQLRLVLKQMAVYEMPKE